MHKGYEVRMTPSEQTALRDALVNTYTECRCTPVLECAGHRFLSEHDRTLSRVERLLYVRRTLATWQREEFTGKCKVCGGEGEHAQGEDRCRRCRFAVTLGSETEPMLPTSLPW
jgi:hypothetical protein